MHRSKAKGDGKSQKGEKEKEKEKKKKGKGSKGAGIGGKNMKRGQGAMPGGLEGSSVTKNGKRIGFGHNVGTCAEKAAGCPGGRHVCTKCQAAHPNASPVPARSSSSMKDALPRPALIPAEADETVDHIHGISFPPGAELEG